MIPCLQNPPGVSGTVRGLGGPVLPVLPDSLASGLVGVRRGCRSSGHQPRSPSLATKTIASGITFDYDSGIICSMVPVPETAGPRNDRETRLRRTAERQQMRLVRSTRRDPKAPEYGTY